MYEMKIIHNKHFFLATPFTIAYQSPLPNHAKVGVLCTKYNLSFYSQ